MKRLFTLCGFLLCFIIGIQAAEVTFVAGEDVSSTTSITKDGITITLSSGTLSRTDNYRVYKDATITISSSVGNITSVNFTCPSSNPASNLTDPTSGSWSEGVWTGDADEFSLTASVAQCRITEITVTTGAAAAVKAPVISGESKFTSSTDVSIASELGTSVYYTTDGTDPTTSSTAYSSSFTIDETTTVKAIAVKGSDKSSVASMTFTKINSVATIDELNALGNGMEFVFTGQADVVYVNGSYVYIQDETGSSLIYKSGTGMEKGNVIASGWEGKVSIYHNLFEVIPSTTLENAGTGEITYPTLFPIDMAVANMNKVGILKGVNYSTPSGKNFTITTGDQTIVGYNQFNIEISEPEADVIYDIEGVISVRDDNVQFQPISITAHTHNFVEAGRTEPTCLETGSVTKVCECGESQTDEIPPLGHDFNSEGVCSRCGFKPATELEVPGTVIWSSEEGETVDWGNGKSISIPAENFAEVKVGDILNIGILGAPEGANPDNWGYQLGLQDPTVWKFIEANLPLSQSGDYVSSLVVTGDMLKYMQAHGVVINGAAFNVKKVAVESKYSGSDESIWVGDETLTGWPPVTIYPQHFENANDFAGVEAGQIIRVNCTPAAGLSLKYQGADTSWGLVDYPGLDLSSCATETGYDIPVTDELVSILKTDRMLLMGDGSVKLTSVELLPAPVVEPVVVDITVEPADGSDIGEAVAAAAQEVTDAGNIVGDISIKLVSGGNYTISKSIVANQGITIDGAHATIDASGLTAPFIAFNAEPTFAPVESGQYVILNGVGIFNVTINGLTKALFSDNGKSYVYQQVVVGGSVIHYTTQSNVAFNFAASMAVNLSIYNSTFYSDEPGTANFIAMSGKRPWQVTGFEDQTGQFYCGYNTFYNIAKGKQFFNTNTLKGQKYLYEMSSNIFVDVSNKKIYGNMTNTSAEQLTTDGKNTYLWDGVFFSETNYKVADEGLGTDPTFRDAANGDFAIADKSEQALQGTGDPRWGTYSALAVTIGETANGTVKADKQFCQEGDNVTLTVTPAEGYELESLTVKDGADADVEVSENSFTMPATDVTVTATFKKLPVDVDITVESGKDIAAEVAAAADGADIKSITVTLAENGEYTISSTLQSQGNVTINGAEGATIDASGLSAPLITLNGGTTFAPKADGTASDHVLVENVTIKDVTVKGLKDALVKDAQKSLVETVTIDNSVIEMPASGKNVLDFNGKGYAGKVIVKNSTIWSAGKNTGFFAQYGSRPKNVNGDLLQEFDVQNSTIVNIANGKNFCDLKQNGTAQNVYTIKNNIFSDCGKAGQVVVGFNKGQTSATPVWDVDGNTFLLNGADNSEAETSKAGQKDGEDIVKNSLTSDPEFADAANGDFTVGEATDQAELETGDPRWLVPFDGGEVDNSELLSEIDEARKLLKYSMPYYDEHNEESPETEGKALVDAIREAESKAETANTQKKLEKALEALKQAEIDYTDALMEYELAESEAILAGADPADELAAELQRLYDTQDVVREDYWNQPKNIKNYADRLDEAQQAYLRKAINELMPEAQAAADVPEVYKAIEAANKALDGNSSEDLSDALDGLLAALETATGIRGVEADESDAPVYNMAGQRVSKNVKGIVIKNGKKIIRK